MESKKINQLATELTPALSDLTIIGDPTTGISKKITLSQMASLFTGTVEEYANVAAFPLVGVADTIYIALDTNVLYRWDTGLTSYVELSPNIINSLVFSDANGFDGNISLVGSVATLTITTALTTGSVPFIGASGALSQDNANLFFDDTNNRLGINTNAPTTALDVFGSGIIGRLNGTSTNNAFLGFSSAGSNKWSIGNVQSDHRFRIYNEATTSELVSVLQTGEFGIGIANPTTKFHIDGAATALIANLDANVSVAKSISFRSDNSNRINLEVSGTESGSNAGANFFIRRYSDAGALIDTPLTITRSTGSVGIGTILPTAKLMVLSDTNTSATNIARFAANNNSLAIGIGYESIRQTEAAGNILFETNSTERMRIESAGNVGIGSQTPSSKLTIQAPTSANPNTGGLSFKLSNGTTYFTIGVNNSSGDGSILSGAGGGITFHTDSDMATSNTRMKITNLGNVLIGTTTDSGYRLDVRGAAGYFNNGIRLGTGYSAIDVVSGAGGLYLSGAQGALNHMLITSSGIVEVGGWGTGGNVSLRIKGNAGGQVGFFNHDGQVYFPFLDTSTGTDLVLTSGGYINKKSSSIRYKENIEPIDIGLDFIMSLNPVKFNIKSDGLAQVGFVAEEFPDERLVTFSQVDIQDASKGLQKESINYAQITAPLVKAIQELKAEIDILKAK